MIPRKWLRKIPAETDTFKESTKSSLGASSSYRPKLPPGMFTTCVAALFTSFRSPLPSLPKTMMVGALPTSISFSATLFAATSAATTRYPCSAALCRKTGMFPTAFTVMISRAPAEALLTTGDSLAEFLRETRTPLAPKKYALRSIAPRFCGSVTSSKASQTSRASVAFGTSEMSTGSISEHSKRTPWCGRPSHLLFNSPLSTETTFKSISLASCSTVEKR
mmetsp:Transcript_10253/g.38842  ORF Transcript_10253/g.38842 Transcript_10253/m.38842 type:complete len:221 (+) Transcript_10253:569-1231(+)